MSENRVIIAGSRSVEYSNHILNTVKNILSSLDNVEVVSGTARGADLVGERIAKELGLPVKKFPANWKEFGSSAGKIRNKEMADYSTHLILIWDGSSSGSKNMLEIAKRQELKVNIIKWYGN